MYPASRENIQKILGEGELRLEMIPTPKTPIRDPQFQV
jgi:hypothetical protein